MESEERPGRSPGRSRHSRPWASGLWIPLLLGVGALLALDPPLWFQATVPALTDLPGHLLAPHVLFSDVLPRARVQGWSFDWFNGFPVYRYYFPLPGLLVGALGRVIGDPLALRVIAALPMVLLPLGLWIFTRTSGTGRTLGIGVGVVGSTSLLMTSHSAFGGNILSVVSGEFSYAWSVLFVVIHVGFLGSASRSGWKAGVPAGVAMAAAVLSHVVPVMVVALGTAPFLVSRGLRARIISAWGVTAVLSAFWFLPMATSLAWVGSPSWSFTPSTSDFFPTEVALLLPAALLGVGPMLGLHGGRLVGSIGLAALALAIVPQGLVMQARPLPMWYLAVHIYAGAGIGHAVARVWSQGFRGGLPMSVLGPPALGLWLMVVGVRGVESDRWRDTMDGVPARPGHADLRRVIERLSDRPADGVYWERGEGLQRFGGRHTLELLPLWTPHSTLGGLLAESSPLSEFLSVVDTELTSGELLSVFPRDVPHATWSPSGAVPRLRSLGVRYLVTHSDSTSDEVAKLTGPPLAHEGILRVFDLGPSAMVETLPCWIEVPFDAAFRQRSLRWFEEWSPGAPRLVAFPGRDAGSSGTESPAAGGDCDGPGTRATEVQRNGEKLTFSTTQVGVPHLVRASYFPTWRVDGGRGPFPASPWFMVVIPEEETVTLTYHPGAAHTLGGGITIAGLLLGLALAWKRRSRGNPLGEVDHDAGLTEAPGNHLRGGPPGHDLQTAAANPPLRDGTSSDAT